MVVKSLLRDYLQRLQAHGLDSLPVDTEARELLRLWWKQAARPQGSAAPVAVPSPQVAEPLPSASEPLSPAAESPVESLLAPASVQEPLSEENEEELRPFFRPGGRTPEEAWELAQKLLPKWTPLQELGSLRSTPVWGQGNRRASIMFVGDAPNYYDEQAGKPFSGEAGGKLDGMLKAMGLSREDVYITHLVKFRPSLPRQTFNNRPPNRDEIRLSVPVLEFEANAVQPKVIVALGVIAARGLLQRGDLPLASYQEFSGESFCGIPVVVTHHPSYLLRTTALEERRRLWEEMLRVMEMAHLPISEKQRNFFLPKK